MAPVFDFGLIEPIPIEDEFCSGLACIEDLGEVARFVLYTQAARYEEGGLPVRVVHKKIILPHSAIRPGIDMALEYVTRRAIQGVRRTLHLVT